MDKKITRRKFVKGVAGAAVCCACFPLDSQAASKDKEIKIKESKGIVHLAAACGIYCGVCPSYINKHGDKEYIKMRQQKGSSSGLKRADIKWFVNFMNNQRCDGCLSGGKLAGHCQKCDIRLCALKKQKDARCSDCEDLPCYRLTNLINMGNYPHRQEYLPNLKKIHEMGVEEWVKYEEERWRCPKCGMPVSWYDTECVGCGAPRSERLFPLP
jgi:hypothetical protein